MKSGAFRVDEPDADAGTPFGVQLLSFLCGLVVAVLGFKSVRQDFIDIRSLTHLDRYTQTPGKILQVKVRQDSAGSAQDCYPDVLYEYFVAGKSIWGWRLSYEEEPKPRAYWEARLARYSVGASVPVFYNPDLPKDAILEKKHGNIFRTWMKMLLGLGFVAAGLTLSVLPASTWLRDLLRSAKPSP